MLILIITIPGLKTLLSIGLGLIVFLILGPILDVELAHLFGVLTFLFNYIPNVGALIACMLPMPIVILDPDMPNIHRFLAIILPVTVHMLVGNFVEPYVFGSSMELHPVVVLLSLAIWFSIWGIPGAILSVPITAVMRIVLSHMDNYYAKVFLKILQGESSMDDFNTAELGVNEEDDILSPLQHGDEKESAQNVVQSINSTPKSLGVSRDSSNSSRRNVRSARTMFGEGMELGRVSERDTTIV
jgi:hypothetical protein